MRGEPPMATASRILGDQVGSTAPVFLAILAVHVIAGPTAVITGAIAALARKAGPPASMPARHRDSSPPGPDPQHRRNHKDSPDGHPEFRWSLPGAVRDARRGG